MVDMFFYRDPEEVEKAEEAKAIAGDAAVAEPAAVAEWDPTTAGNVAAVAPENIDWAAEPAQTTDWAAEPAAGAGGWDAGAGW